MAKPDGILASPEVTGLGAMYDADVVLGLSCTAYPWLLTFCDDLRELIPPCVEGWYCLCKEVWAKAGVVAAKEPSVRGSNVLGGATAGERAVRRAVWPSWG